MSNMSVDRITRQVTDSDGALFQTVYQILADTCDSIVQRDEDSDPVNSGQVAALAMSLYLCNEFAQATMQDQPNIDNAFDGIPDGMAGFPDMVRSLMYSLPSHYRTNLTDSEYRMAFHLANHVEYNDLTPGAATGQYDWRWSSEELQGMVGCLINRYFTDGRADVHSQTAATLIQGLLTMTFKPYLDQIALGSDPVEALTNAPFWQEGGGLGEVATRDDGGSSSMVPHQGYDHLSLQEQLDIVTRFYDVPADEYQRWSTVIFDADRLVGYAQSAASNLDEDAEYEDENMDVAAGY